jgi:hypothetical protein
MRSRCRALPEDAAHREALDVGFAITVKRAIGECVASRDRWD